MSEERVHELLYSCDSRTELCEMIARLEDENDKLQELVRILYYCELPWKDCDKCAINGADMHVKISNVEFCDGMYDRMRELGVEA